MFVTYCFHFPTELTIRGFEEQSDEYFFEGCSRCKGRQRSITDFGLWNDS